MFYGYNLQYVLCIFIYIIFVVVVLGEYYFNNSEMLKLFYKVVCEKSEIVYVVY